MLDDFTKDLKKGRAAEKIVFDTLRSLTTDYEFTDVSKDYTCYKIGDIRATDKVTGKDIYIEVKNDSRIADTHKVLCEEEVYYLDRNSYGSGNMDGYGDIYVVVSEQERKIYIMDLKKLQKNYRKGEYKEIPHAQQTTYCYLCSLEDIAVWGALIRVLEY